MIRMIGAVVWKEWKGLQPLFWFIVLFFIYGLLCTQFDQFMDQKNFWGDIIVSGEFFAVQTMLLALLGCFGLVTREKDEQSLIFLEGLPVKRSLLYCIKSLLVFILVAGFVALITGEVYLYERMSLESMDTPTPLRHVAMFLGLNVFLVAFFVAVFMLLSYLRLFSLLFLTLYAIFVSFLSYFQIPGYSYFNPFLVVEPPREVDDPWVFPWARVIVCTIVGGLAWATSFVVFCKTAATSGQNETFRKVRGWVFGILGSACFLILALGFIGADINKQLMTSGKNSLSEGVSIKTANTERFQFVYRSSIEERLQPLIDEADQLYETVANLLEAEENPSRIVVDFTQPLGSHNAGQAYWNKIRMGLPERQSLKESKAILGHEIVHVLIDRITKKRLSKRFGSARWFHEGLASYVEYYHFREAGADQEYNRWLALASTWEEVSFAELVNNSVLVTSRDQNLAYPAGLEFIEAAVEVYGEEWIPQILQAIGRDKAPELHGIGFWADSCQACDSDLERIRAAFRDRLEDLREENKKMCARLPEVTEGKVTREKGKIVITPELPKGWRKKAPKNAVLMCRVRPNDSSQPFEWRYATINAKDKFEVSSLHFRKPNIGFQAGWQVKSWCPSHVFGEWVNTTIEKE